jgi:hypothetical protein
VKSKTTGIPLVFFRYPDSKTGEIRQRKLRVTRADGNYIQGFEVQNSWDSLQQGRYKKFSITKLKSAPVLAEFIQ